MSMKDLDCLMAHPGSISIPVTEGIHRAWDSLCFDYGKDSVIHFLLSNCSYWLEEYKFDGFRFDGITSMIYYDHGLEKNFTSYNEYFDGNQDEDALVYLYLANKLIHQIQTRSPDNCRGDERNAGYSCSYRTEKVMDSVTGSQWEFLISG